eukprot:TRINITY_DN2048_c0_g2_i1.p1 TRINITY_DN2048_c0_g2~~TRINITY_DN2048_c0_g2_i1.p1  ORF type:complete len:456 (+),score=100.94 TRINITY_DN2048_c0_g2_i1:86-1453(+)
MSTKSVTPPVPSTIPGAIFNMVNAIMGAGLVSLAYAWAQAGFMFGWFLFVFTAVVTAYTLELLINLAYPLFNKNELPVIAYEVLCEKILGIWGRRVVLAAQFLFAFGISVGYVVIIHDEIPTAMKQLTKAGFFDHEILVVLVVFVGILLPIAMLRSVSALAMGSYFSFATSIVLIGIVSYELATDREDLCEGSDGSGSCEYEYLSIGKSSALSVYGIFVFTKACHHAQFQIYRSLGPKATPDNWKIVVRWAIFLSSLLPALSSMIVYATFGQGVDSDFFKNYWKSSNLISIARLMFGCVIGMAFPMQLFVCRETLQIIIASYLGKKEDEEKALIIQAKDEAVNDTASLLTNEEAKELLGSEHGREQTPALLHYGTTLFLFSVALGIGISTDNLGSVLSLVGGTAGSTIGFILPGLIGYRCEQICGIQPTGGRLLAGATAVFGVMTFFVTSIFTFV